MIKPWPIIRSTKGPDMGFFSIKMNCCRSPRTGQEHDFYVIDFPDWVQIIPITADDQVVMVRQYRHGCGRVFLELPGGLIDKEERSPHLTAERELLEETGYRAENLTLLTRTCSQPAVLNSAGLTFVAKGAKRVSEPNFDAAEDIEVCLVELQRIPEMIRTGEIEHGQTVMALSAFFLLADKCGCRG
ncbi:MAG TPA: NUDIX hydrolase [Desulfatiglandales bacterium]|nr:NUDIX hydrolase [Desulfatiglandales bacterium]